jgi:hypothetical protein
MPDLQDEINKKNATNAIAEVRLKFICYPNLPKPKAASIELTGRLHLLNCPLLRTTTSGTPW